MTKLSKNFLMLLSSSILLIVLSFYFLDKPLAFFIYNHHINHDVIFKYFTYISPFIYYSSIVIFIYSGIKFILNKLNDYDQILFTLAISTIISYALKGCMNYVFGRTWPLTWSHNNPSLINNHIYGFHFFHGFSRGFQSFPSGHTTIVFAAMSVLWITIPKLRWLAVLLCGLVIIGLLGMDYHFISDIIAGACLGTLVGYLFTEIIRL